MSDLFVFLSQLFVSFQKVTLATGVPLMLNGQFLLFLAAGSLKPFIPKHFIRITIFLTLSTQNKMFGKENKENDHTVFTPV